MKKDAATDEERRWQERSEEKKKEVERKCSERAKEMEVEPLKNDRSKEFDQFWTKVSSTDLAINQSIVMQGSLQRSATVNFQ